VRMTKKTRRELVKTNEIVNKSREKKTHLTARDR
jgi:hypothetical protein